MQSNHGEKNTAAIGVSNRGAKDVPWLLIDRRAGRRSMGQRPKHGTTEPSKRVESCDGPPFKTLALDLRPSLEGRRAVAVAARIASEGFIRLYGNRT